MFGDKPEGARTQFVVSGDLRQCDKTEFGIARIHELIGLADVLAHDKFGFEPGFQFQGGESFDGGLAIRRRPGVGNGQFIEAMTLENLAVRIDHVRVCRPQRQFADGVGKAAARHGQPVFLQASRLFCIGTQKYLEGRAVPDLGIEPAGGARRNFQLMTGGLVESLGDLFHGRGEIRRHSNVNVVSHGRAYGAERCTGKDTFNHENRGLIGRTNVCKRSS